MQEDDFVLFDDGVNYDGQNTQGAPAHDPRLAGFNKPSFLQHRGNMIDSSPLIDEAPYGNFARLGQVDPVLMQRAMQGDVPNVRPDAAGVLNTTSPNATPPQPSSGTLGAPLTMLSLQGEDQNSQVALFPDLEERDDAGHPKRNTYMPTKQLNNPNTTGAGWPYPPNQAPSKGGLDSETEAPFFWNAPSQQSDQWKPWGTMAPSTANADILPSTTNQASQVNERAQNNDRLTVSPRDLYLDHNGAPSTSGGPELFPSRPQPVLFPSRNEDETSLGQPFGLSSAMEGGSSTEEEDDEDEKPFPSSNYAGSVLGATAPNEQLLQQWSRSMYGPTPQAGPDARRTDTDPSRAWTVTGPSFSAMSTSSESEEDTPARQSFPNEHLSGNAAQFANTVPGALGGYGYIPGSQESGMSVQSTDSETGAGSHMSASMTESDTPGTTDRGRSPSILNSAQAITPLSKRTPSTPPNQSEDDEEPAPHPSRTNADVDRPRLLRSTSNSRRKSAEMDVSSARQSTAPTSSDSSSPENDESDYEETQLAQPTPRSTVKRGRSTRTASGGHSRKASASGSRSPPTGHTSVLAGAARSAQSNTSPNSSAIRCDYVSPVTGQRCGTIFHRMYDLARHRITLHLREEAQLVKDGKLKVEQCVVLGKEVDVKKAMAELEWICRVCGASFSRKDALLRHERLRHHR